MSAHVPLMIGTVMSYNSGIPALWTIPSHVPRLMTMVACHLPRMARSPDSALALIAVTPSLKSPWNRSLLFFFPNEKKIDYPSSYH